MAAVTNTNNLTGLARAMVNHGWLSEDDAEGVWKRASQSGDSFVTELIKGKRFKADQVAEFAAISFGFPFLDLNAMDADNLPKDVLDPKLVQKRRVIALYHRGNKLYVATSDPTHLQALDEVKFQTGQTVEPVVVEDDKLGKLIQKAGEANDNTMAVLNAEDLNLDFADEESAAAAQQDTGGIEIDDAPVVRYLQKIMLDAINLGASDIHFEPYEKYYRIRYRRDGILSEVAQPPMAIKDKVASRIKVLSRLDISEKRVPQEDFCQARGVASSQKYEQQGGPGIDACLDVLKGGEAFDADARNFLCAQLLFWFLAAIDGHAKNFSLFVLPGGRYRMTPLYDVLSAWPLIGTNAHSMQYKKVKLAMAVRSKAAHFKLSDIQYRHWQPLAQRSGAQGAWQAMLDMAQRLDGVLTVVEQRLPTDFPTPLAQAIFQGARRHLHQFQRGAA
ncbi:MAG: ATPase, T2SS/T4P/T4SS family [Thiobacillus sp.]|nr:ATPase, T2SS/T4P/T4SS family [Thiobacillus sp.]